MRKTVRVRTYSEQGTTKVSKLNTLTPMLIQDIPPKLRVTSYTERKYLISLVLDTEVMLSRGTIFVKMEAIIPRLRFTSSN